MNLKHRLGNFFIVAGGMGVLLFIASVLARANYDLVSLLWGVGLIALGINWSLSKDPTPKPAPPPKPAAKPALPPPAAPKPAKPGPLATLFKGPKKAAPPEPPPPPPPPPKPKGLAALFTPREKK